MKPIYLHLSCEHAVNTIPMPYQMLFKNHEYILDTHRAIDIGAKDIAHHLHNTLAGSFTQAQVSRLIIDCNRSLYHSNCFSEFTRTLSALEKEHIINTYYQPFRKQTHELIQQKIDAGFQVLHLSVHSFTSELKGIKRNAAIGLLYDYNRHGEREVSRIWRELILLKNPSYRVRMNYPYHGTSDGFTSFLRKHYSEHDYLGIELEMNEILFANQESKHDIAHVISTSLAELLQLL